MNPSDPLFVYAVLSWILNVVFAGLLFLARVTFNRAVATLDDMDKRLQELERSTIAIVRVDGMDMRLRELERTTVTHGDLHRLEIKMDGHYVAVTERLDRLLERQQR